MGLNAYLTLAAVLFAIGFFAWSRGGTPWASSSASSSC